MAICLLRISSGRAGTRASGAAARDTGQGLWREAGRVFRKLSLIFAGPRPISQPIADQAILLRRVTHFPTP